MATAVRQATPRWCQRGPGQWRARNWYWPTRGDGLQRDALGDRLVEPRYSDEESEITASAWSDLVANKRGQRGFAVALILQRKGYPRVHVGGGRVAGPGALAWFSVLRWANEELLVEIGLNAARLPDP
jgi:hypothetical protein